MEIIYDAVIIGAGPAGGQCARDLARHGRKVLLVEKSKNFQINNYSSGGAPQSIMEDFSLPSSIAGTFWNRLTISSTKEKTTWESDKILGPVLDFDKLRLFLAEEALSHNAELLMGYTYLEHSFDGLWKMTLKSANQTRSVKSKVLVDATGSDRKVLAGKNYQKKLSVGAAGLEYHITVSDTIYDQYANTLNFYLGHYWMPQGYAWIFPMEKNKLKVGVIRYFIQHQYVPHNPSFHLYLEQILDICGEYSLLDKHGKTLYYTPKQKDVRTNGSLIAIGDAISCVNPLGSEGIRHALVSGRLAAEAIQGFLEHGKSLREFDRAIDRYFGMRWRLSEKMMHHIFKVKNDRNMDGIVKSFRSLTQENLMQVAFEYRFSYTIKAFLRYYLHNFHQAFLSVLSSLRR